MADSTWVVLLRGVNVGGKNKLAMRDLVALLEQLGCSRATTFIQSGNAVLEADDELAARLCSLLGEALATRCGLHVPVVLRSATELAGVLARNPFVAAGCAASTLHVAFLAERPHAAAVAALDPARSPGDRFAVDGREVFLHLPAGVARSKLTNAWLDRALGTTSTVRTWATVGKLAELAAVGRSALTT